MAFVLFVRGSVQKRIVAMNSNEISKCIQMALNKDRKNRQAFFLIIVYIVPESFKAL